MKESGELTFGQLPALRTSDGKNVLVQSAAIIRYVAKLSVEESLRLYPDDIVEAAKVDAVLDQEVDISIGLTVTISKARCGFGILGEDSAEINSPDLVKKIRKSLNDEVLPRHLKNLEMTIDSDVGPWLGGQSQPSIADFVLVQRLKSFTIGFLDGISTDILNDFPKLLQLIDAFENLDSVKEWNEKNR